MNVHGDKRTPSDALAEALRSVRVPARSRFRIFGVTTKDLDRAGERLARAVEDDTKRRAG